ncbi:MAG: dockerin type I repeat-containing protein [Candidatus Zixiibacteriota bacterium]
MSSKVTTTALIIILSMAAASFARICGDATNDDRVNILDATYIISSLYKSGPAPEPLKVADVNNSNSVNILDVTYLISSLFKGGDAPNCSIYLGQVPPDSIPQAFATGLISTTDMEFTASFDPSFQEFYFTRRGSDNINRIYYTRFQDGSWIAPDIAPFCGEFMSMEPLITPDGQKLFFSSTRPCSGCGIANWYVVKEGSAWSAPQTLEAPLNSLMMMYSTQSSNGNIYFTNISALPPAIYISQFSDGLYQTPTKLGTAINKGYNEAHPYIAPDESYIIFDAQNRPGGFGGSDLYISYHNEDGSWTESVNLGSSFNTAGEELAPTVSPDGKYFFFAKPNGLKHDIFWCSIAFIDKLRPAN